VFDLASIDARASGFRGATYDGRFVYFIPALGSGSVIARVDTQKIFDAAPSWEMVSLKALFPNSGGFSGATFDGQYLYLAPGLGPVGVALRLNTRAPFTSLSAWTSVSLTSIHPKAISFSGAVYDGKHVFYAPWRSGAEGASVVMRFDPQGGVANPASWSHFDVSAINAKSNGFRSAAFDGRFVYFVPGWTAPTPSWSDTVIVRFDSTGTFDQTASWSAFDVTAIGADAGGFNTAAFDGRFLVLSPGYLANRYNGVAYRLDTQRAWSHFNAWSRFETTSLAAPPINLRGVAYDGRYMYFAPSSGVAARYDATTPRFRPPLPQHFGSFY